MDQRGWTLRVPVPTAHAYARLVEFARMPDYVTGLTAVRRTGDDLLQVTGPSGDWVWRITEAMPGRGLVLEPLDPAGPALRVTLEPDGAGTSLTMRVTPPAHGAPLEPRPDRLRAFLLEDAEA